MESYTPVLGFWYDGYALKFGIERSWGVMLCIWWLAIPVCSFLRAKGDRLALGAVALVLLFGIFGKWALSPERRLRELLRSAHHATFSMVLIDQTRSWSAKPVVDIHDQEDLARLGDAVEFANAPWAMVFWFTRKGEYVLEIKDSSGQTREELIFVNRGQGLRWEDGMNADAIMTPEFMETFASVIGGVMVRESLPRPGTPPWRARLIAMGRMGTPECVEVIASQLDSPLATPDRELIARCLYMGPLQEESLEPLLALSRDPELVVRKVSWPGLAAHAEKRDSEEARAALVEAARQSHDDEEAQRIIDSIAQNTLKLDQVPQPRP